MTLPRVGARPLCSENALYAVKVNLQSPRYLIPIPHLFMPYQTPLNRTQKLTRAHPHLLIAQHHRHDVKHQPPMRGRKLEKRSW